MEKPKVLLFDLGGVIVRWTGIAGLSSLTGLSEAEILATFAASEIFKAYEIGKCNDDTFIAALIDDFQLDMSPADATKQWNIWVGETYEGTKRY